MTSVFVAGALLAFSGMNLEEALARQTEMLSRIESVHARVDVESRISDGPSQKAGERELWRAGHRERSIQRACQMASPQGPVSLPPEGRVTILVYDDHETRRIYNWDPEHPRSLKYNSRATLGCPAVGCTLQERNKQRRPMWDKILFQPVSGTALAEIITNATVIPRESGSPEILRFELRNVTNPSWEGCVIDLDTEHGCLVSRVEYPGGAVAEVEDFVCIEQEFWVPARIRTSQGNLQTHSTLVTCEINTDISEPELTFDFPEGARVDDQRSGKIYVWGRGEPELTFENRAEFIAYLKRFWMMVWSTMLVASGIVAFLVARRLGWLKRCSRFHSQVIEQVDG